MGAWSVRKPERWYRWYLWSRPSAMKATTQLVLGTTCDPTRGIRCVGVAGGAANAACKLAGWQRCQAAEQACRPGPDVGCGLGGGGGARRVVHADRVVEVGRGQLGKANQPPRALLACREQKHSWGRLSRCCCSGHGRRGRFISAHDPSAGDATGALNPSRVSLRAAERRRPRASDLWAVRLGTGPNFCPPSLIAAHLGIVDVLEGRRLVLVHSHRDRCHRTADGRGALEREQAGHYVELSLPSLLLLRPHPLRELDGRWWGSWG